MKYGLFIYLNWLFFSRLICLIWENTRFQARNVSALMHNVFGFDFDA